MTSLVSKELATEIAQSMKERADNWTRKALRFGWNYLHKDSGLSVSVYRAELTVHVEGEKADVAEAAIIASGTDHVDRWIDIQHANDKASHLNKFLGKLL